MTDIFHEIEEDLRRERLRKLWDRFGGYIVALALAIVLGTAGWSAYKYWRHQEAAAASAEFQKAVDLAEAGKPQEAEAAFAAIAKDAPAGYRAISLFRAAVEAAARDPKEGIAAFDAIGANAGLDPLVRDLAKIRAALILVDTAPLAEIATRLDPLAQPGQPLRNSAREILALAQYKAGDLASAHKTATAITEDADASAGVRSRAELIRLLTNAAVAPVAPAEKPTQSSPATQ